jgi:hypothetical protein
MRLYTPARRRLGLLLALTALAALAGAVVGGVLLDRTVLDHDDGYSRITEAEHDRLCGPASNPTNREAIRWSAPGSLPILWPGPRDRK